MPVPHLLLLVGSSPAESHGGEIWLHDLSRAYPRRKLSRFSVVHRGIARPAHWLGAELEYAAFPREHGVRRFGSALARMSSTVLPAWNRARVWPALLDRAVDLARRSSVNAIWAILDSGTIMALGHRVAERLGVPLFVSVLDPPERWTADLHLGGIASARMLEDFEASLRAASGRSVISEAMAEEYAARYGVDSIVLRHGVSRQLQRPARGAPSGERLTIAFAGTLYRPDELRALVGALESVNWQLGRRTVNLRIIGQPVMDLGAVNPTRLQFHGWRTPAEAIALMSGADIAYLPYWMDREHETAARLCFPTKLAAYLAAGTPVLFHGPAYSAAARFLARYPAGVVCDASDPAALLGATARLLAPDAYCAAVRAAERAVQEELNLDVFLDRFAALIGVSRSALSDRD